jgi:hypothetical protein
MFTNHNKKISNTIKTWSFFLLLLLYFYCCKSKSENMTQNTSILYPSSKPLIPAHIDSLQQTYIELEIEELFWHNRMAMAHNASIDMAIDLVDSTVDLEIKGVTLRKTKISKYEISRSMTYLKWYSAYKSWLGSPFLLKQDSVSSIPKEPVFLKDLTTHTLEYFDDWTYFNRLEKEGTVHYLLEYDRDLLVQVDQDSDVVPQTEWSGHWLRFSIPATDAKAIYRALAKSSQMVLRY